LNDIVIKIDRHIAIKCSIALGTQDNVTIRRNDHVGVDGNGTGTIIVGNLPIEQINGCCSGIVQFNPFVDRIGTIDDRVVQDFVDHNEGVG
jgi:hypothetical protein